MVLSQMTKSIITITMVALNKGSDMMYSKLYNMNFVQSMAERFLFILVFFYDYKYTRTSMPSRKRYDVCCGFLLNGETKLLIQLSNG